MSRGIRSIGRIFERTVRGVGDLAGGIVDNVLGTNITGNNGLPSMDVSQANTGIDTTAPTTPTTPNQAPTENISSGDGKFSDVVSVFDALNTSQEDDWDKLLGRKFSK